MKRMFGIIILFLVIQVSNLCYSFQLTQSPPFALPPPANVIIMALADPSGNFVYLLTSPQENYIDDTYKAVGNPSYVLKYRLSDWTLNSSLAMDDTSNFDGIGAFGATIDSNGSYIYVTSVPFEISQVLQISVGGCDMFVNNIFTMSSAEDYIYDVTFGSFEESDVLFLQVTTFQNERITKGSIVIVSLPSLQYYTTLLSFYPPNGLTGIYYYPLYSALFYMAYYSETNCIGAIYGINNSTNMTLENDLVTGFAFGWENYLIFEDNLAMYQIETGDIIETSYITTKWLSVLSRSGPFFFSTAYNDKNVLFWPSHSNLSDWSSIDLSWMHFETNVFFLKEESTSLFSFCIIPFDTPDWFSFSVEQIDVSISSQNEFQITNHSTILEFPRGMTRITFLKESLDRKFLYAAAESGLLVKLDLSYPLSPSLVDSVYLLGRAVDLDVNENMVAVLTTNYIYDLVHENYNPSNYSTQLFDIHLQLLQTIPLPVPFTPYSLSIIGDHLIVVGGHGYEIQSPEIFYFNIQTNESKTVQLKSNVDNSYMTSVKIEKNGEFAFVGTSDGMAWKLSIPDLSIVDSFPFNSSVTQIIAADNGDSIVFLADTTLISFSISTFLPIQRLLLTGPPNIYNMAFDVLSNIIFLFSAIDGNSATIFIINGYNLNETETISISTREIHWVHSAAVANTLYISSLNNYVSVYTYSSPSPSTTSTTTSSNLSVLHLTSSTTGSSPLPSARFSSSSSTSPFTSGIIPQCSTSTSSSISTSSTSHKSHTPFELTKKIEWIIGGVALIVLIVGIAVLGVVVKRRNDIRISSGYHIIQ